MTVYFEYVLIDNFVIDYLLLKSALVVVKVEYKTYRLIISAVLGGGIALVFPLIEYNLFISIPIKVLSGVLLVLISAKFNSAKRFYITTAVFIGLTFALGGAIIGIYNLFGLNYNGELSIALIIIPAYLLIKGSLSVIKFIYNRKNLNGKICECEITLNGKREKLCGFIDTGNGVYYENAPVCFADKRVFDKLINDVETALKVKEITFNTVAGEEKSLCIKVDEIKIYYGGQAHIFNNVRMARVKNKISEGLDIIIHPGLLGDDYDKRKIDVKKVS